eukprot:gene12430-26148_t
MDPTTESNENDDEYYGDDKDDFLNGSNDDDVQYNADDQGDQYNEDNDYEDDGGNHNSGVVISPASKNKEKPYITKNQRPIYSGKSTNITLADAKLYGLPVKDGKVVVKSTPVQIEVKSSIIERVADLATRKPPSHNSGFIDENTRECKFAPSRTKEAEKAMRDKKCGYDFVTKLNEKGSFLERAFTKAETSKSKKSQLESMKEDYEAKHDRLQCPTCRKHQSFDEYMRRQRICQQCQQRYVQLNIANRNEWEKRQKEKLHQKEEKIAKTEEEMYNYSFKPTVLTINAISEEKLKIKREKTEQQMKEINEKALKLIKEKEIEEKARRKQDELRAEQRIKAMNTRIYEGRGAKAKEGTLEAIINNEPPTYEIPASKKKNRPSTAGTTRLEQKTRSKGNKARDDM